MSDEPMPHAIVAPGVTSASLTDHICGIVLHERRWLWWWIAFIPSASLVLMWLISLAVLLYSGIGVWGVSWPVMWGFAILSYVWWIAIASGGTFISALFFLTRSKWRSAINRIAESMLLSAIVCAGIYPIFHLGRPWFFYWLFPYPNNMTLWPQWRSPLTWDFYCLFTYVVTSILFYYIGLIPDLASVRDSARTRWKQILYGVMAMGFRGTAPEWRRLRAVYAIMAAIMAPVVCSVHSVVGLDFAGGLTIGWHSTEYPPFFVFGALLSGFAMVIMWVLVLRHFLRLHAYITEYHIDVMGRLMLASSIALGYGYLMDAWDAMYSNDLAEHTMFVERVFGYYNYVYWSTIAFNITLPQTLWFRRLRLFQPLLFVVCFCIIGGMWFERYEIVVTSLHRTHLPSAWGVFHGTIWDWTFLFGTVGILCTLMLLFVRLVPMVSMYEMREVLEEVS